MAQSKRSKIFKAKLQSDRSFVRIRENIAEFTVAGKAGMLIRNAFRPLVSSTSPNKLLVSRMQKGLMEVLKSDLTSDRGARLVSKGDISKFKDFDFNDKALLSTTFYPDLTVTVDRATGKFTIKFPPFVPIEMLKAPVTSTHYRLLAAAAEVDFVNEDFNVAETKSIHFPLANVEGAIPDMEVQLTAGSQQALLMVLSIEFYQEVNGKMYLLKDDRRNAVKVIYAESATA